MLSCADGAGHRPQPPKRQGAVVSLGLKDFAGPWRIDRLIRDTRPGRSGRFRGDAVFEPAGPLLRYHETGEVTLDGAAITAEQTHIWRQDGNRICVTFSDGRPFHKFEIAVPTPKARHHCPPDLYHVAYDFGGWPEWWTEWRVSGPSKDYTLSTRYRRAD